MSLEPMEKPSKCCRNSSARMALEGSSHIMTTRSAPVPSGAPPSPRFRPWLASSSMTRAPSLTVRTKGIISWTLVRPMSSRTRFMALHSISKQSEKVSDT